MTGSTAVYRSQEPHLGSGLVSKVAKILGKTVKCIHCREKDAVSYTAHVVDEQGNSIIAGWCEDCRDMAGRMGYVGRWCPGMGLKEWDD